jgi:hypothetical protein
MSASHRRERIEAAVVAGGRHASGPHEAWIAADPFLGGVKLLSEAKRIKNSEAFARDLRVETACE